MLELKRQMPAAPQAEMTVIGALLGDNSLLGDIPGLTARDFFEPVLGRVFEAIQSRAHAGAIADAVILGPLFDDDPALARVKLADLQHAASTVLNVRDYADVVFGMARRRELIEIGERIADRAADMANDRAVTEIVGQEIAGLERIVSGAAADTGVSAPEVIEQMLAEVGRKLPRFSSGIPAIDLMFDGGIPLGRVLGFEARPKTGKTIACATLALAAAKAGYRTVYYALEMGAERLGARLGGTVAGFNGTAALGRDETAARLLRRARDLLPSNLIIEDQAGLPIGQLRSMTARHIRAGAKVFVLDYYQLVRPSDSKQNQTEFLDGLAQWCAETSKRHEVTWLIAAQQNRTGFTRGSDGLVMACDWHCVMHKCEQRVLIDGEQREALWLEVSHNRDGSADSIGEKDMPVLFIDWHGPSLAQIPGTSSETY